MFRTRGLGDSSRAGSLTQPVLPSNKPKILTCYLSREVDWSQGATTATQVSQWFPSEVMINWSMLLSKSPHLTKTHFPSFCLCLFCFEIWESTPCVLGWYLDVLEGSYKNWGSNWGLPLPYLNKIHNSSFALWFSEEGKKIHPFCTSRKQKCPVTVEPHRCLSKRGRAALSRAFWKFVLYCVFVVFQKKKNAFKALVKPKRIQSHHLRKSSHNISMEEWCGGNHLQFAAARTKHFFLQ